MLFYTVISIFGIFFFIYFVKETKNRNKLDLINEYINLNFSKKKV